MWSNGGVLTLIEDLQRGACLRNVHLQITKTIIQKGVASDVLAKKCKISVITFEKKSPLAKYQGSTANLIETRKFSSNFVSILRILGPISGAVTFSHLDEIPDSKTFLYN
jgi:hypothetical protein